MRKRWIVASVLFVAFLATAETGFGAVDMFLKIDGIAGESMDGRHRGEIDVLSWSFGESRPAAPGSVANVQFKDFVFTMRTNKASVALFHACSSGQRIREATLTLRRAGRDPVEFLRIRFTDVAVSSYTTGGSTTAEGGTPIDQVSLSSDRVEFQYTEQNKDGTAGATFPAMWDAKSGKGSYGAPAGGTTPVSPGQGTTAPAPPPGQPPAQKAPTGTRLAPPLLK